MGKLEYYFSRKTNKPKPEPNKDVKVLDSKGNIKQVVPKKKK